ncbi:MAG: hypothetical protein JW850_07185 [Thermoflexales bacterium]|nr:hypothetical protein [Thermoflexales bacterium]
MITSSLLTTKLYIPPSRPKPVERPRLIERLDEEPRLGRWMTLASQAVEGMAHKLLD